MIFSTGAHWSIHSASFQSPTSVCIAPQSQSKDYGLFNCLVPCGEKYLSHCKGLREAADWVVVQMVSAYWCLWSVLSSFQEDHSQQTWGLYILILDAQQPFPECTPTPSLESSCTFLAYIFA